MADTRASLNYKQHVDNFQYNINIIGPGGSSYTVLYSKCFSFDNRSRDDYYDDKTPPERV